LANLRQPDAALKSLNIFEFVLPNCNQCAF
jgi:hypothetical protein